MRIGRIMPGRIMVVMMSLALLATACTSSGATTAPEATANASTPASAAASATTPAATEPVTVCELAYYTGSFADYGKSLTNDVRFPIEEVIDKDPPLGRTWELVSEDIGDDHEGQAAKICVEQHHAEVVVSIAHQYRTYRD